MDNERSYNGGFSGIGMTAALSVLALVGVIGWKIDQAFQTKNTALTVVASAAAADHSGIGSDGNSTDYGGASATSTDPSDPSQITDNVAATLAADYAVMKQNGTYSSTTAAEVAQQLGANLKADVSYKTYSASALPTTPDTSYAAMLAYRAALQTSLAPLAKNTEPEINILTDYVQTNDPTYLTQLEHVADNYKLAVAATAAITVPADATTEQAGILNAMQEFAATLDQMVASANDPFAEATLINTYMQAQSDMISSFNNLYAYYKSKQS